MGGWIEIRLQQPGPNRDAIGSWIEVKVGDRMMLRDVTVGGGHGGGQLGWINIGLGDAQTAEVRVRWPGGETGPWLTVRANGFAVIDRGASAARPWLPAS